MFKRFFSQIKSTALAILFSLLLLTGAAGFPIAGLFMLYQSVNLVWNWHKARSWVEVPATIESVRWADHSDSESTSIECVYAYEFAKHTYTGHRIGHGDNSDNIGDWYAVVFASLREAQQRGGPVPCYVDPANPSRAVLYRDLRTELLLFFVSFAAAFLGISLFAGLGLIAAHGDLRVEREQKARWPDQPWKWKSQWATGLILSESRTNMLWAWVLVLISNAFTWHFAAGALTEDDPNTLLLLLPLLGVVAIIYAIHTTRRHLRFGKSVFRLDTLPGRIGGKLAGDLVLVAGLEPDEPVKVTLNCIATTPAPPNDDSGHNKRTLWSAERAVPLRASARSPKETALPVEFEIPSGCLPSREWDAGNEVSWQLIAVAALPRGRLTLSFNVPVF